MRGKPRDEELLEAESLEGGGPETGGKARGLPLGEAVLLVLLLGVWAWAVHGWFTNDREVAPSGVVDMPEVEATATVPPTVEPTATAVVVAAPLRLETAPAGASVLRNGRFAGVTPLELFEPREGETVQITLSGHATELIRLGAGEGGSSRRIELRAERAWIKVRLEPAGAGLWVDGQSVELPPDGRLLLPQREHVFRAEAEGYRAREVRATPAAAFEREVDLRLKALAE